MKLTNETGLLSVGDGAGAPAAIKAIAQQLSEAHGCQVRITQESSGYHAYLPCPDCLHTHGSRELSDPKYSINLSKYLGIGDRYSDLRDVDAPGIADTHARSANIFRAEKRDKNVSVCMRTRSSSDPHRYSMSELLAMDTVSARHPDILTRACVIGGADMSEREEHWEYDVASGKLCPPPPGDVTPITELPADHPGVQYMLHRGYDLQSLWEQFRCSWCERENRNMKYRFMPNRWKDTAQHRVVFYSLIDGAPMCWQARVPEVEDATTKWMLHPYDRPYRWDVVATRSSQASPWIPVPPFDELDNDGAKRFSPSKYRTAKYASRELMGWDAAIKRADADPSPYKWIVLCEGPLDAARIGPGAVALLGSSISPERAATLASKFHLVMTAFDRDAAGAAATEKVRSLLLNAKSRAPILQSVDPVDIPSGCEDVGTMTTEAAKLMIERQLSRSKRFL